MSGTLTRNDIIDGIRDLVLHLREAGSAATIQIVGGAAIAPTIDGDRAATVDIDGPITPPEAVTVAAAEVARNKGWPPNWVNDEAKIFLPWALPLSRTPRRTPRSAPHRRPRSRRT